MEGIGILTILVGILGGVAVGIQAPIANAIGQRVGSAASSVIVHVTGTVFSVIVLLLYRGENIQNWRAIPWWMYFGGLVWRYLVLNDQLHHPTHRNGCCALAHHHWATHRRYSNRSFWIVRK